MTRVSARHDGVPTEEMAAYYAEFADGGFGLVVTEGIYPDAGYSQGYLNQPGLVTEQHVAGWRMVVNRVHAAGGRIVAQLMHAGALSQGNPHRSGTIAPSAVPPLGEMMPAYGGSGPFQVPREASRRICGRSSTASLPLLGMPLPLASTESRSMLRTDTCSTSSSPSTPTSALTSTAARRRTGCGS